MEAKEFKELFNFNCKNLNLVKFKTAFLNETESTLTFLILRKSGYSTKYYLRVKTVIKPTGINFNKEEFIKHDVSEILLSLDSENPEIFDLENNIPDEERKIMINLFFQNNVKNWLEILSDVEIIKTEFIRKNYFLLPYTKEKLGIL